MELPTRLSCKKHSRKSPMLYQLWLTFIRNLPTTITLAVYSLQNTFLLQVNGDRLDSSLRFAFFCSNFLLGSRRIFCTICNTAASSKVQFLHFRDSPSLVFALWRSGFALWTALSSTLPQSTCMILFLKSCCSPKQHTAEESLQILCRFCDAICQITIVGTNERISEIPRVFSKDIIDHIEALCTQVLYHKYGSRSCVDFAKRMNLP